MQIFQAQKNPIICLKTLYYERGNTAYCGNASQVLNHPTGQDKGKKAADPLQGSQGTPFRNAFSSMGSCAHLWHQDLGNSLPKRYNGVPLCWGAELQGERGKNPSQHNIQPSLYK